MIKIKQLNIMNKFLTSLYIFMFVYEGLNEPLYTPFSHTNLISLSINIIVVQSIPIKYNDYILAMITQKILYTSCPISILSTIIAYYHGLAVLPYITAHYIAICRFYPMF
jgi:hypothetical protein